MHRMNYLMNSKIGSNKRPVIYWKNRNGYTDLKVLIRRDLINRYVDEHIGNILQGNRILMGLLGVQRRN